jgi:sensor histidine kinase YesM
MLKAFYISRQYFFNMLAVLVFLVITRLLDGFAWYSPFPGKTKMLLLGHLSQFISFFPLIFLLIFSYTWAIKRKNNLPLYFLIIVYTVLAPAFVLYLSSLLEFIFGSMALQPITFKLIEQFTPGGSMVILFLSATYFLTHLKLQSERQREAAHKTETLAKDVQLKMLRYQINPHFLFNVLNSIYTLIDENTEKAKKLVLDMSEYYRYTLSKQEQTISIEKEVESIIKYLEIQKTRFEEKFHYEIFLEEAVKSLSIPSFLIHLLVENAVKYGTKTSEQKLIVLLSVTRVNDNLLIRVSNTGKLLVPAKNHEKNIDGTSNGIENLKSRLALYYDDNFSFSLKEDGEMVIATIEIGNISNT